MTARLALAELRRALAADPTGELRERAPHVATRAAVDAHGEGFVKELWAAFDEYNRALFGSRLRPPLILVTYTAPRALADHVERDPHGLSSVIRIHPRTALRGFRFAADVLLHEMVHTWATEVAKDAEPGYRGHGPKFASQCNAIGLRLGLAPVGVKRRKGLPDCAQWPVCVRPEGSYGNARAEELRQRLADAPRRRPRAPPWGYLEAAAVLEHAARLLEQGGRSDDGAQVSKTLALLRELAGGDKP